LGDRARGALERSRALYVVIKILRASLYLGILKLKHSQRLPHAKP